MELRQTFINVAIDALEMKAQGNLALADNVPHMATLLSEYASELLDTKDKLKNRSNHFTPKERQLIEGALNFSIGYHTETEAYYIQNGDTVNRRREWKKKRAAQDALEDLQQYELFTK